MSSAESIKHDILILENMLAWEEFDTQVEALREAIHYLNKQLPQPIQSDKNGLVWCPQCKKILNYIGEYCSHCGQKLTKE